MPPGHPSRSTRTRPSNDSGQLTVLFARPKGLGVRVSHVSGDVGLPATLAPFALSVPVATVMASLAAGAEPHRLSAILVTK
ncbi:hypothetical protein MRX96_040408 [Rhipicephalus microplus]